ncbi:Dibenzothiophene monooxygenase [Exophiala dermatitidis]
MGSIGTSSKTQTGAAIAAATQKYSQASLPNSSEEWLSRAREVAQVLSLDAPQRDIEGKSPFAEVSLLKASGLTKLLGPAEYGGAGQDWATAYKAIREVARGDGSIGMLLGYHLLWSTTANVVGTEDQKRRVWQQILSNNWFLGGAVNPRSADLKITEADDGKHIIFNGFKYFNTGGVVSDATILEGVLEGSGGQHIFTLVPTNQPGIQFSHDWDNIGMRLTESGSVKIENVRVPWTDAFGWDSATKKPIESILSIPYASLLLPTIQLVFSNFYLGIALGALDEAKKWTTTKTRAWPYVAGGDVKDKATDEHYILAKYGNFHAHLRAAEALADRAGEQIRDLYADHAEKRDVSARRRGEVAEWVASIKVVATDTGLRVTNGIFEVTGASSTARKVGLDRFWRDLRVHSLHDPVAYKEREVGRFFLLDEVPEPTWYT